MPANVTLTVSASAFVRMPTRVWLKSPLERLVVPAHRGLEPGLPVVEGDGRVGDLKLLEADRHRLGGLGLGLRRLGRLLGDVPVGRPVLERDAAGAADGPARSSRTTMGPPPPITFASTLARPSDTRRWRIAARVSPWKRSTPTAVRSSRVRVRLGKWRKKLRPTSLQSTRALTFSFTAVFTRCAIRSRKRYGRTASSTSTSTMSVPAMARMREGRFIGCLPIVLEVARMSGR